MRKILSLAILCPILYFAQVPTGYYNGTQGLTGYALKSKLQEIISKNYNWNYSDLVNFYKQTDIDVYYDHTSYTNPTFNTTTNSYDYILLDIYSEKPTESDAYEYNTTQIIGNGSAEGMGFNREHMIPQSTFKLGNYSSYPMYSDLFYVIPTDARINQLRSNYPYGVAGSTIYWNFTNSSKIGNSSIPGYPYTGRVYEPIDEFKGDVARTLLYFAVRYEGLLSSFNHKLGSGTITPTNDQCPLDGTEERAYDSAYISMLKQWHQMDPVSQREIDRNNSVFLIQKNRNPFIDNPHWVDLIWSFTPDGISPNSPTNLSSTQQNAHFVTLNWTPSSDTDILGYKIYMNGAATPIATTKNTTISIDRLTPNTTYTFAVRSYDNGYLESPMSNSISVTTIASDTYAKDLMITKYLEGTSNNKALEITNLTGHEVNLNNYNLNIQFSSSGNYYFSDTYILQGKVAHGESFVVINPEADFPCYSVQQAKFVTASTPLTFTGSQYIELAYRGLETVDAVGNRSMSNSNSNVSLYRLNTINQPNTVYTSSEWQSYSSNYCQGLGNLSTEDVKLKTQTYSIYPNPVTDILYVKQVNSNSIKNKVFAKIVDVNGRLIMNKEVTLNKSIEINVSNLEPGNYFLNLDNELYKFIKK